jgi:CheY-like chemotaxis protein
VNDKNLKPILKNPTYSKCRFTENFQGLTAKAVFSNRTGSQILNHIHMLTDRVIPKEIKDKVKILVVEDNLLCRKLVTFFLKKWGYKYDVCANGKLALENLKLEKYDLILLDIQMPEMDGIKTAQKIRIEMKLGLPIIAMTSHASEEERERCLKAGINDYLTKPINEEELYNLTVNYLFIVVVENQEHKMENKN